MGQNYPPYEEIEFNFGRYIDIFVRQGKVFCGVFLAVSLIGLVYYLTAPKLYSVTMLIQPPAAGEPLGGMNDLESAETLKGMIINDAFNDELSKRLPDRAKGSLKFTVVIPEKTNILQVSVLRDSRSVDSGAAVLTGLCDVIASNYAQLIDYKNGEIGNQIKQYERLIINAQEKGAKLQEQIGEIMLREDKLREELNDSNKNMSQLLARRDALVKRNPGAESATSLFLANFFQNHSAFLNQMNNQFSQLSIQRSELALEIRNIDVKISEFQMLIDKLRANKVFISNVRILSQPKVSPVLLNRAKAFTVSLVLGLFSAVLSVFISEFIARNKKEHA